MAQEWLRDPERCAAAAVQVDFDNPMDRSGIRSHVDRMLALAIQTVEGNAPFSDVKLLAFPEFAHPAPRPEGSIRRSPGRAAA